jgi:tape measure domain-containing protein
MSIERKIKITLDASSAKASIDELAKKLNTLTGSTGNLTSAQRRQARSQTNLNKKIVDTNRSLNAMNGLLRKVATAATIFTGIRLADDFNELQNRLRITLQEGEKLVDVQESIIDVSLRTRSALAENALLYLRLSNSVDRTVTSQAELLKITETVNKAVQLGGSSAQEAAGAVRQFTQIISAGFSSGFSQEINSISEQTPGLFKLIENGLRETSKEFRELEESGLGAVKILKTFSEEGIGDLDTLLEAINSQFEVTNEEFKKIDVTVSKALGNLKTGIEAYIGRADDALNITPKLAQKINDLAINFDDFAFEVTVLTAAMGAALAATILITAAMGAFNAVLLVTKRNLVGVSKIGLLFVKFVRILTPIGVAFTVISLAVVALIKDIGVFEDGLITVGDKFTDISGLAKAIFKTIGDRFKNFASNIIGTLSAVANNIRMLLTGFYERWFKRDVDLVIDAFNFLGNKVSEIFGFILDIIPFKAMAEAARDNINTVIGFFVLLGRSVSIVFEGLKQGFKDIFNNGINLIKALGPALIAAGKLNFKEAGEILSTAFADSFSGSLIGDFETLFSEAKGILGDTDFLGEIISQSEVSVEKFKQFVSAIPEAVRDSFESSLDFITFAWTEFKEDVEKNIDSLNKKITGTPLSLELEIDPEKINLFEQIELRLQLLGENLAFLGKNIVKNLGSLFSKESAVTAFGGFADAIEDIFSKIGKSLNLESIKDNFAEIRDAMAESIISFTDLFSTLSSIRQDKLDEELRTSVNLSDEERAAKEKNAKASFDNSKRLTLAGIALQTGLAIMNALAQTTPNFLINLANAAGAAAMGAAQYAKANAQQYKAPSAPSGGGISAGSSSISNNTQNVTTTVNITGGVGFSIEDLQKIFDDDVVIINKDSAQGRQLRG